MRITCRLPKTDEEKALMAALMQEGETGMALRAHIPENCRPRDMDQRRFDKILKRERDASAVRFAALAARCEDVMPLIEVKR